jgi:hypothetical protein
MDLKGIISVSGMSGLFKVIAQTKNGFIIEALSDKKRTPIQSSNKVSALEDISVFKTDGEIPLSVVFKQIKEKKGASFAFDLKADSKVLRDEFKACVPDFDEERVYTSDIKKIFNWFLLLKEQIAAAEVEAKAETPDKADKKTKIKAEPKAKAVTKVAKANTPKSRSSEPKQSIKAVRTQKKG